MNKKILYILFIFISLSALASDKLYVKALEDFSSAEPKKTFKVQVIENTTLDKIPMLKNDVLYCTLNKVTDPTRGKRNAKVIFNIISYEDSRGIHEFENKLIAKYSKSALTKKEIAKKPSRSTIRKTAGFAGNLFLLNGISYGLSFADGVAQNQEGNRLKSGAKQVYEDSFLSYVEYGDEIEIKKDDLFYLIAKEDKE